MNLSLGLETPRLEIIWFLSEPPSCMGTPRSRQKVPQLKSSLASMWRGRGQLMNLSLGLETPRLGIVWFLSDAPLLRGNAKVENSMVPKVSLVL